MHERFAALLADLELTQAQAGEKLKCHQAHVSDLMRGKRCAGLELALRIEELSKDWEHGPIDPREWIRPKGEGEERAA